MPKKSRRALLLEEIEQAMALEMMTKDSEESDSDVEELLVLAYASVTTRSYTSRSARRTKVSLWHHSTVNELDDVSARKNIRMDKNTFTQFS